MLVFLDVGISGFLDAGETPYDAVVREIHEESGLPVATIKRWNHQIIWDDGSHRTYLFYVDKYKHIYVFVYICIYV